MISSQPRYDRFDTAADMSSTADDAVQLLYSTTQQFISQGLFTYEFQETVSLSNKLDKEFKRRKPLERPHR